MSDSLLVAEATWLESGEEFVVRTSPQDAPGYWAGAPQAVYDAKEHTVYLYYRLRRPRGSGRGYESRIARSRDGIHFEDVWSVTQEALHSPSIERGCLAQGGEGWILYLSYVNGETHQWQIDRLAADRVEKLDPRKRKVELDTKTVPGYAVKDPFVLSQGPMSFMYVSYAPLEMRDPVSSDDLHAGDDVFTTGKVYSHTGLAISVGGERHRWVGEVLGSSSDGWDSLVSRVSGLMRVGSIYLAFYDGAADVKENYEERVGLAISSDLRSFYKLPSATPWMQSRFGSLRYVAPVKTAEGWVLYYETTTDSGAHVLCGRKVGTVE